MRGIVRGSSRPPSSARPINTASVNEMGLIPPLVLMYCIMVCVREGVSLGGDGLLLLQEIMQGNLLCNLCVGLKKLERVKVFLR